MKKLLSFYKMERILNPMEFPLQKDGTLEGGFHSIFSVNITNFTR